MGETPERTEQLSPLKRALLAIERLQSRLDEADRAKAEPIAVIGVGCRFPGGGVNPKAFWQMLRAGTDAIAEVPGERWNIAEYYDPDPDAPGKMYTRWGSFIDQVDQFDARFFGIAPREVVNMDPQQRLLLEVSWEALEHAGQVPDNLLGSLTGVFVGIMNGDYTHIQVGIGDTTRIDAYTGTGGTFSAAAGRLAYAFGFQGPAMSIDTACSSSLVAVHLACQSLRAGESNLALAGGVNLILSPLGTINLSKVHALAPDGHCKTFDAAADGYVRGEGCGVVVLKRLSDAVADSDPILAVIRGSAVNQDGRSSGLTVPNGTAQQAVIRQALVNARVEPREISYIEAHGTGTPLGDPIEIRALEAVLGANRPQEEPLIVGSVKTNFGHLESAAGIAGLIKTVLACHYQAIPPHLNFKELNPHIALDAIPAQIPNTLTSWQPRCGRRLAGVSAFSLTGTNAHVVIEEAPQREANREQASQADSGATYLLPLSARSPEALRSLAAGYRDLLATADENNPTWLHDLCYTASLRRSHHEQRMALVGDSPAELVNHITAFLNAESQPGLAQGSVASSAQRKIVFVFPGQGAQWIGMGRQLLEREPVFRAALEACDQALRLYVDWSVIEQLTADEQHSRLDQIDVIQPTLWAIQVALATLWRSWGVQPRAVVGHSMGEIAAAHIAGALSLEDAARIVCRRSRLLRQVRGQGAMAVVELSLAQAQAALGGYEDRLSVAVSNSPRSTVLSGDPTALQEVLHTLERQEIFCRPVKVDVASHSPQMEPLRADLLRGLAGIQPQPPTLAIYSTVTGGKSQQLTFDAAYWVRNLREPVLFSQAIQALAGDNYTLFLEISPHPILSPAIDQCLRHQEQAGLVLPSLRRDEPDQAMLLGSLGALYTHGYPIDWGARYPTGGRCLDLPAYPWQHQRFWIDDLPTQQVLPRPKHDPARHPLLGDYIQSSIQPGTHYWESDLDTGRVPFLADHRVQDAVILPAAAFIEMALAAAASLSLDSYLLEHVSFQQALVLPDQQTYKVQLVLVEDDGDGLSFRCASRSIEESQTSWTLHVTGTLRRAAAAAAMRIEELHERGAALVSGADFYAALRERGLQYGPAFQRVEHIRRQPGAALARLQWPDTSSAGADIYQIDPTLLDACFQIAGATLGDDDPRQSADQTFVPAELRRLRQYQPIRRDRSLWVHAAYHGDSPSSPQSFEADLFLLDDGGQVLVEIERLRLQALEQPAPSSVGQELTEWLYALDWQPSNRSDFSPPEQERGGRWLIFADRQGLAEQLKADAVARDVDCLLVTAGAEYRIVTPDHYQIALDQPDSFQRLLADAFGDDWQPCRGIIHLWSLDTPAPAATSVEALEQQQRLGCGSVVALVQALAGQGWDESPRLWLVTRGAQATAVERTDGLAQAPLWGLGRTLAQEQPELRCTLIDLQPAADPADSAQLFQEIWQADAETQIALRGKQRYVARLIRQPDAALNPSAAAEPIVVAARERPFRLDVGTLGILDTLALREVTRSAPGPGEVEIEVRAAGLNFNDVLKAMGLYPGLADGPLALGSECSGIITAAGEGVTEFQVGDEVVAIAQFSFGSVATTPALFVAHKPARLSFEEAATIPVVFMTAYYALHQLARLEQGERILIHAAAGGVGLAAIQIARQIGAEIFATAGSAEKRAFLRTLGIQQIMDSRSLDFAEEVLAATGGAGVDVVLNSLSGKAVAKGLASLGLHGRFVEIGKRDIYQNSQIGMLPFQKNLAFFALDLDRMFRERPAVCQRLLRDAMRHFEAGTFQPLPLQVFPIAEASEAFHHMAQARHIGKIVLSLHEQPVTITPIAEPQPPLFRADSSYLITGGLGGIGLTVAQWMVAQGARHLALLGRREPSPGAQETIAALEQAGAQIEIIQADVAQPDEIAGVLTRLTQTLPPLRGVFHAAGILDDGIVLHLDQQRLEAVMAPKVAGTWNLHTLTADHDLDYFVLFSSAASLLGSPGQANYAAGNAFMDALAQERRAQGLPALSVNWGPWADVGLAAAQRNRGQRLAAQGIASITPEQGITILERLLRQKHNGQIGVIPVSVRQWRQAHPLAFESPLFSQLAQTHPTYQDAGGRAGSMRALLMATESPMQRRAMLEAHLQTQAAQVLRLAADDISLQQPFGSLGFDSLMALEFRNRLEASLELTLSATLIWSYPTIETLTTHLAEKMQISLQSSPSASQGEPSSSSKRAEAIARLNELSDDEAEALLLQELMPKGELK